MLDDKETATMWQDRHAGKRGHQLMTQKLAESIPAIYANENVADYDTVLAVAKLFSPYSNWTWYITEMDAETGQCFGLVDGFERELGYFDLTELAETTVFGGVPAVERDLYWEPKTLGEIKNESKKGLSRIQEEGKGETMPDETETEIQSQDVVNVEEFLFGGVTDDNSSDIGGEVACGEPADEEDDGTAEEDDTSDDAAGESPTGDATDDAGDMGAAGEPDADTEPTEEPDAAGEPDAVDAGAEQSATGETETSEELKVVLSIRGNRATIGVQRPSADPHIESFDDPDLFGLADEFPAVVARARARWEEEPMHPAYVKPAPPARRQRQRRQQEPAQPPTDAEEAEQQQPETLRLF